MQLWQIIVLAVIQGTTEFLPISSDGHLVVAAALINPNGPPAGLEVSDLVIVLHGGTLLSIVVFYWRQMIALLCGDRRTIGMLVVATIPAILVGLPVKLFAEHWLESPLLAGIFLIVTGVVLLCAARGAHGLAEYPTLTYRQATWIGIAQAAAILPGLSRSGCTISTGLRIGLSPSAAATFSFLMAIPVIGGACLLETITLVRHGGLTLPFDHLAIGVTVSFVVGLFSLTWLVRWLERGRFALFAWWCIPLGITVLVWQLSK